MPSPERKKATIAASWGRKARDKTGKRQREEQAIHSASRVSIWAVAMGSVLFEWKMRESEKRAAQVRAAKVSFTVVSQVKLLLPKVP